MKWKPQLRSLSESEGFWIWHWVLVGSLNLLQSGEEKRTHLLMHTLPSWPLSMLSLLAPILLLPPGEHRVGGWRAATSTVPPSPPHLISVVHSFETSVSRRTKEWWSMCNKCQCHGNPRFPPKIFLFIPFEDLSPGRAGITRPRAKPWQSLFSACSLID